MESRQQRIRKAERKAKLYGGTWRDHLKDDRLARRAIFYGDADDPDEEQWANADH